MLARRLTTILPAMTLAEAIETTRIHSVAGLTGDRTAFVTMRPFRAPQHTISDVGLIGGGYVPMLGKVSLANQKMLYLMSCQSPDGTSLRCRANRSWRAGLQRHHRQTREPIPVPVMSEGTTTSTSRGGSGSQATADAGNTRRAASTTRTRA
jgi:Magnesium chelatase, subunit ChlI